MGEGLSRRDFLKAAGRLLVLGGIGALAATLLGGAGGPANRRQRPPIGETCLNEGLCRGCASFAGCGLPSALSARERAPGARVGA